MPKVSLPSRRRAQLPHTQLSDGARAEPRESPSPLLSFLPAGRSARTPGVLPWGPSVPARSLMVPSRRPLSPAPPGCSSPWLGKRKRCPARGGAGGSAGASRRLRPRSGPAMERYVLLMSWGERRAEGGPAPAAPTAAGTAGTGPRPRGPAGAALVSAGLSWLLLP